jgi:hypothetical protein
LFEIKAAEFLFNSRVNMRNFEREFGGLLGKADPVAQILDLKVERKPRSEYLVSITMTAALGK